MLQVEAGHPRAAVVCSVDGASWLCPGERQASLRLGVDIATACLPAALLLTAATLGLALTQEAWGH